jgi:hypothetical protein
LNAPFKEFKELDVEDTEVEAEEDSNSFENMPFELRPRTGEEMALRFIGYPV